MSRQTVFDTLERTAIYGDHFPSGLGHLDQRLHVAPDTCNTRHLSYLFPVQTDRTARSFAIWATLEHPEHE
jgi:hypothetical protein